MRLLVIKHGALGDIIQGLDTFASLRAHHPDAHISVLTTAAFAPLMKMMPFFDEVLIDERAPFWNLRAALHVKSIFQSQFDIILDLQCSKRTARYHSLFAPKSARWLGTAKGCSDPYPDFTNVNNKDRMLHAAQMIGAKAITADLSFLTANNSDRASGNLGNDLPYAVLMPGCSPAKPSKRWPAEHYGALADLLWQNGIQPVVVGTKIDLESCDAIARARDFVKNECGKTNLSQLAILCAGAKYCVGNDSGPVFLAAKTGAHTLMLMGPDTNPAMSAPSGKQADYMKVSDLTQLSAQDVFDNLKG